MKRLLAGCLCAASLLLASCAAPAPQSPDPSDGKAVLTVDTGTQPDGTEAATTIVVMTDAEGQIVTDSGGHAVTSIITAPPTEIRTVTDTRGEAVTGADGQAVTSILYATTTTAGTTTPKSTHMPASTTIQTSTTTRPTTTTTKPRKTTTRLPSTTTTAPRTSGPWYAPYDLPAIYADCKKEIERLGMVWREDLRPDTLGVSWANPESTVVFSYYPNEYSLKDYVMNELIPFYKNQPYTRRYCRIWMEPDEDDPGDYHLYFLEVY